MTKFLILAMIVVGCSQPIQPAKNIPKPSELEQVLNQVQKNNPSLNQNFAKKLAKTIVKKSNKYKISPRILAAILMQESSYKISAKNLKCGISISTGQRDCVAVDFGIGQINHRTIKSFKFNTDKLLSDLDYSVEASAKVLADFKRMYGKKDPEYWTRYNAGSIEKRNVYKNLVARHM